MLINDIIDFCDKKYITFGDKCGCGHCNHPSGSCSGSCYDCLYQIHYPNSSAVQKLEYDCPKMIYHYVCQYSTRYASEILYAFNHEAHFLSQFQQYNIMSIGCGACADLMAFEMYYDENACCQPVSYSGYDVNPLWKPVHNRIARYCDSNSISRKFFEVDAIDYFQKFYNDSTNIIVISYLISYLYNTTHKNDILQFFDLLIDNVIKRNGSPKIIIFNDVNSCYRGRDYFPQFIKKLEKNNLHGSYSSMYFDTGNLNSFQKVGSAHSSCLPFFSTNAELTRRYHIDGSCRSAQMIVEVK